MTTDPGRKSLVHTRRSCVISTPSEVRTVAPSLSVMSQRQTAAAMSYFGHGADPGGGEARPGRGLTSRAR